MAPPTPTRAAAPTDTLLHARLILPPASAWNGERYCGARLQRIDAGAALDAAGVRRVVNRKQLVAVIADTDHQAREARRLVRIKWSKPADAGGALRERHAPRLLARGADAPPGPAALEAVYQWQAGSEERTGAPLVALAIPEAGTGMRIDLPFGNARAIAQELAQLLRLAPGRIDVRSHRPPAGERESADASHAAGVAALLAQECGAALSLVLEAGAGTHLPTVFLLRASLGADGSLAHYAQQSDHPAPPPPLAWLLTETPYTLADAASAAALAPPYDWAGIEISGNAGLPPAAAAFAQESFFDEAAASHGADPVQYRLDHLPDAHGAQLIRSVTQAAGWRARDARRARSDPVLRGRGFAYASTIEHEGGRPVQSWSAWVADVEYDRASGELSVTRVTAGHDLRGAPSIGAQAPALEGAHTRPLDEQARLAMAQAVAPGNGFDAWARENQLVPAGAPHGAHLPAVDVVAGPPAHQLKDVQLKAGGAFTLPAAAAVANAIHDATGVRLRSAPFTGEQVRLALAAHDKPRGWRRLRKYGWLGGAAAALGATLTLAMPWRPAIAPIQRPDPDLYSAATIERGRLVALAGDCAVCHTAPGGAVNTGGHALQTPFGAIYSTNITPDEKTGIGNWSYAAFERAMREGVHRDGRQLYPAFPYTAFARITEADMQALYAYLMAQPAAAAVPPENDMRFPFNLRPLLSGWNLLFHRPAAFQPDPDKSALWNRGAYLVEGAGHCAACHSPRNLMGAEKGGRAYLTGGTVDGWEAPALTSDSKSPNRWSEDELFGYLRTGFSSRHGIAAGPMAPVVAELAQLPAGDVRAIAHYLASFNDTAPTDQPAASAAAAPVATQAQMLSQAGGKRLFEGACAACHQEGTGPTLFGVRPSLRVNTNLHSDSPDNLIHVILHGIREPADPGLGYMPGFANSFSDAQVADLLVYLRTTFAPDKPAWAGLEASVAKSRARPPP